MRWAIRGALLALVLVFPGGALAAVSGGQPFPSNLFTVHDHTQLTGLRVNLPQPNCTTNPTDCNDVAVLNQLDGFNIQPRISVPFSDAIDPATVTSKTVFLIGPGGHKVGINQVVWEPGANTIHFESDEQLKQDSRYLLVVTRGVKDADGKPIGGFRPDLLLRDRETRAYGLELILSLPLALFGGVVPSQIADASVFTTQSITAISQKIRAQLHADRVNFALGAGGERTVFPLSSVASVQWQRQVGTSTFQPGALILPLLGGVGRLSFGTYVSPDYETADEVIPAVGTRTGVPAVQSTNDVQFTLFEPAGTAPAGGWPIAIFGHGFTDWKNGAPPAVAGTLARNGIASIAINVVGHGGGPLGTYTVTRTTGERVTFSLGGRGIDQDGNGTIDSTEGVSAVGANALIGNRDGLRQTTIDLMQLVKVLKAGIDVDGDGASDLSTSRIYYAGQSFGGIYGVQLLGLEPDIRAGVPNVPGGSIIEIARLSPAFRALVGVSLFGRSPSLYNANPLAPGVAPFTNFVENIPLRNQPLAIATPDQAAIQNVIDDTEWAQQAANPAAYAPFVNHDKTLIQFARGDQTVPNPTASAILRAGHLADRATLYRNDLAYPLNPQSQTNPGGVPKNPHTFLTNLGGSGTAGYALAAQQQIATFFASDGAVTIDPDGAGPFFETPTSMVPEDLAYIP